MDKDIMSITEAAEFLGFSKTTVYSLLKKNAIPAAKIASHWMFSKKALEEWVYKESLKKVKK
jgi:excisionase family DNA binding protein